MMRSWFPNDEACLDYLDWVRWAGGFVYPHCGYVCAWKMKGGIRRCQGCRRRVSTISGTIFANTLVPLTARFEAALRERAESVRRGNLNTPKEPFAGYSRTEQTHAKAERIYAHATANPKVKYFHDNGCEPTRPCVRVPHLYGAAPPCGLGRRASRVSVVGRDLGHAALACRVTCRMMVQTSAGKENTPSGRWLA
jgi:hypothetical protein